MLPGWCCIANRHIGARERRQLIPPHVRFQVPFLGPESQLKSGFACAGLLCTTIWHHDVCHWSVLTWLWCIGQFYILFWCLSLVHLIAWPEDTYIGSTLSLFIVSSTLGSLFSPSDENIQLKLLEKSLLVAIPLLCIFCVFWFGCGFVFLVCLVSFGSGCGFLVLAGTARWTVYRSTTSTFVAIDKLTALHDNYNSSFCCDWTCVTTWRKPWRRWTEKTSWRRV